jgi:magnesium transporter
MRDAWQNLILPDLMQMVQEDDVQGLAAFCGVVHPASVAEILEELEDPQVWRILDQADDQLRVEIFEFLSLKRQTELAESLDEKRLSHLLEWMSADDRVDLLSRIPEGRREMHCD